MIETPAWAKPTGRGPVAKYPFRTMAIGEIFRVPVEEQSCGYRSFYAMAYAKARELGRTFRTRVNPDDGAFECWRGPDPVKESTR